jgi:hypothetical protein
LRGPKRPRKRSLVWAHRTSQPPSLEGQRPVSRSRDRAITLGEGRTPEGDTVEFTVSCGSTRFLGFEAGPNEDLDLDEFGDLRRYLSGDRDGAVLDIYEDWARFSIDTAEVRRQLLALS